MSWISVDDRLPEKGSKYNVALRPTKSDGSPDGRKKWYLVDTCRYWILQRKWNCPISFVVTHWQPLPEPPNNITSNAQESAIACPQCRVLDAEVIVEKTIKCNQCLHEWAVEN